MTPENFCYWLQGIFEIQSAGLDKNTKHVPMFSEAQMGVIQQHLNYVFAPKTVVSPDTTTAYLDGAKLDLTKPTSFIC